MQYNNSKVIVPLTLLVIMSLTIYFARRSKKKSSLQRKINARTQNSWTIIKFTFISYQTNLRNAIYIPLHLKSIRNYHQNHFILFYFRLVPGVVMFSSSIWFRCTFLFCSSWIVIVKEFTSHTTHFSSLAYYARCKSHLSDSNQLKPQSIWHQQVNLIIVNQCVMSETLFSLNFYMILIISNISKST